MTSWSWLLFLGFILGLLIADLIPFHRRTHVIRTRQANVWSGFWIILALIFTVDIYFLYERHLAGVGVEFGDGLGARQAALQFLTGYIVEKSLSLGNVFVMAIIFAYFKVPLERQLRLLFWGVLGILFMRGLMIGGGALILHHFEWMAYIFGGLLIVTAVKMLVARHDNLEPEKNVLVRIARRRFPVVSSFEGDKFFVRAKGKWAITTLFPVLLLVQSNNLLFAVDSIPAIFAVTSDPFLVYSTNILSLLGLRALYFAVASLMHRLRYLKISLVFLLVFVGIKMMLTQSYPIPPLVSLAVISGLLAVGLLASLVGGHRDTAALVSPLADELEQLALLTVRQAKRLAVLVIGGGVLVSGVVMLALPGPGVLMILAGLSILATHFLWARRLLRMVRRESKLLLKQSRNLFSRERR